MKTIQTPYGVIRLEDPTKEAIAWAIKAILSSQSSSSEDSHVEGCDNGIRAGC